MIPVPVMPQPTVGLRPVVPVAIPTPAIPPTDTSAVVTPTEGPPTKRARTEDELESEADWLTKVLVRLLLETFFFQIESLIVFN